MTIHYSVAIPAWNAARTIQETITSVLGQTQPPDKVVLVDDGSTDDTAALAAAVSPKVEVIRQVNTGVGAATTRAVKACPSPVVALVDSDDLWQPDKMERQMARLVRSSVPTIVTCRQQLFRHGSQDHSTGPVRGGAIRSSMIMYRDLFSRVGDIIDPPGGRGDMVDWLARAREIGCTIDELTEPLVLRRVIEGSLSYGRQTDKDRGYLYVAMRSIQRRREASSK